MQIRILIVGKVREPFLKEGISLYLSRLAPYHRIRIIEVADDKISGSSSPAKIEQKREAEGIRLLGHSEPAGTLIALDPRGKSWTSEELASRLNFLELEGRGPVVFLIGGSLGIPSFILDQADHVLSLSHMTFPHQLVPLLLLEQLYRATCINRNIPYHK
jgi:23S rRNA (pseudouridine1915-N3)-methyltransferase